MRMRRTLAAVLAFAMLISLLPATVLVSAAEPVANNGIVFTKTAQANGDGTVDITMEAYTTGRVTNSQSAVPADIVLVLDMSGSMDDPAGHDGNYVEADGYRYTYYAGIFDWNRTAYGFEGNSTDFSYYKKNADDTYSQLRYAGRDDNEYEYYTDGTANYYPELANGLPTGRENAYTVIQFYRNMTHMEILKEGASAFIADVAAKNAAIGNDADKHRISIVKFATADYYNGNAATDDYARAVIGDNKNSSNYNYTQVVKDLTVVDDAGKTELTTALNNMTSGGATAVDYGIQLAEKVLGDREDTVGRSEAIIVFTDGSPTHSSSYEADVAGAAINEALALKNAGVKVFAIGGADTANSDILGDDSNQFMHYISNNFPNASYADDTITPGEGSIADGFYMTPSDDRNLEQIFDDIFKQTVELDITLGETAGVVDTISPYFTIPSGTSSVTLQVAEKTAGGWAPAEPADGVEPVISNNTLIVRGFDFDANYVSETPREVDGKQVYGKKLIIKISGLKPDYDEIDLHYNALTGGAIPTNEGDAAVVDSQNQAVATKTSPTVQAKTVTYMVDGTEYMSFYRLPGTTNIDPTALVSEPTKEGHSFSGWDRTALFTMPDENVVIKGSFSAENYAVTYQLSGEQPSGVNLAEHQTTMNTYNHTALYGTEVSVKPDLSQTGYIFSGWYPQQTDVVIDDNDKFTMPAKPVVFLGYFTANTNTPYEIHHYLMKADGTYDKTAPAVVEPGSGKTDEIVKAYPDTVLFTDGYEYDLAYSLAQNGNNPADEAVSKIISSLGNTVIELYYKRAEHTVTYQIDRLDSVPEIAAAALALVPTDADSPYRFGEIVTVEDDISIEGYTFSGWHSHSAEGTLTIENGKFEMPRRDVVLHGNFEPNTNTPYKIEHYVQNTALNGYELKTTRNATGITAATVTADPLPEITEAGFEYNLAYSLGENGNLSTDPAVSGVIKADGTLVLKLYYTRKQFNVSYKFEGNLPAGISASDVPSHGKKEAHGAEVTVKALEVTVPVGYSFKGWYRGAYDASVPPLTTFEMPAHDVTILGHFEPDDGVEYKIQHYLAHADGSYPSDDDPDVVESFTGTTGDWVVAEFLPNLLSEGYEAHLEHSLVVNQQQTTDTEVKGQIAGDGSLVLKLYYKRGTFGVSYVLERLENLPVAVKTAAENMIPVDSTAYGFGQTVDIADPLVIKGYTFSGWHAHATDGSLSINNNRFEMPKRNVTLYGYFEPSHDTAYEIQHYVENKDGDYELKTERSATGTTGMAVIAEPLAEITGAGHVYNLAYSLGKNGNLSTDPAVSGVIKADGTLVLKLYYDRAEFEVSYQYEGIIPTGTLPTLPGPAKYKYKSDVPVASTVGLTGYTFVGWYRGSEETPAGTSFEMPAHDVILLGKFVPKDNTPYHIRHFLRKLNAAGDGVSDTGNTTVDYEIDASASVTRYGTTNAPISAVEREYPGFYYEPSISTPSGNIAAGGLTYLDFYYEREEYDVKYELDGVQPHGVTATVPSDYDHKARFGTSVEVKDDLGQTGYIFTGWYSDDPAIGADDEFFEMPAKPVVLKGRFAAATNTPYTVEYYKQRLNAEETDVIGANPADPTHYEFVESVPKIGTTGHAATAEIKVYEGFAARTDNVISKTIAGDGSTVIKLYYDRVTNPIAYHFYGAFPDHTEADLPAKVEAVPYGVKRTVAQKIICDPSHRHVPTDWASPQVAPVNNEFTMPATKVDFYTAVRHIYKVEYDLAGGTGADGIAYTPFDVFAGTVIDVKPAPTKSGYTFNGWKLDGTETVYRTDDEITVNEDIKLIAQWTYSGGGGGGGGVTRYTLTYETNGGTPISRETYASGTVVQLTKVPQKEDFVFNGWYIDQARTEGVSEVKMTRNITVYADWVTDNGSAGNGHKTPDSLNGEDHFAYVVGYPDGTVRPNENISRAEVTSIFFRLLKDEIREANLAEENSFNDVNDGDWYNTSISTMAKLGIVKGRTANGFVPDAFITRAEFAAICARFDDSEFEVVDSFTDVSGHWAEQDIHQAAAYGWIRGYEDGTFKPDQFITRAEAMTMINRVLNRVPETADDLLADMINWPDNGNKSAWYYLAVQEATNSHDYEMKNHIYEKWTALREVTDWTKYE